MLQGIDVSKWQGKMDWRRAAGAGVQFAMIRAGSFAVRKSIRRFPLAKITRAKGDLRRLFKLRAEG
jgi:hypothetical protein